MIHEKRFDIDNNLFFKSMQVRLKKKKGLSGKDILLMRFTDTEFYSNVTFAETKV